MSSAASPTDPSRIELTADIHDLAEALARKHHEVWIRLADPSTRGSTGSDKARQSPDRVAFDALPEVERDHERQMATDTVKAINGVG